MRKSVCLLASLVCIVLGGYVAHACTYSEICSKTAFAPTYHQGLCPSGTYVPSSHGHVEVYNDLTGAHESVPYSMRLTLYTGGGSIVADDGTKYGNMGCTHPDCSSPRYADDDYSGWSACWATSGNTYKTLFTVGYHWDLVTGVYQYTSATSGTSTAP